MSLRKPMCATTGKRGYRTYKAADEALGALWRNSRRPLIPSRIYQCQFCTKFHLTSQPLKR